MAACDIVIPFYQRKPMVLRRAINSVLAQTFEDWRLIIVDDGSPSPVDLDLEGLNQADLSKKIHVIRQANAGVSGARNKGLDAVSEAAAYVAFLDSDDEWTPDHLARTDAAMKAGADLFWDAVAAEEGFDSDSPPSVIIGNDNTQPTDVEDCLAVLNFPRVLVGEWWRHMHLSCTAVSARLAREIRFREELSFCEDFAFFMDCSAIAEHVMVSDEAGVVRGVGDNVWHGVEFADRRHADEKFNMSFLLKELRATPGLETRDRALIDIRRRICREQFYWNQVHRVKKGAAPMLGYWTRWLARDPALGRLALSLIFKTNRNGGKTVIEDEVAALDARLSS